MRENSAGDGRIADKENSAGDGRITDDSCLAGARVESVLIVEAGAGVPALRIPTGRELTWASAGMTKWQPTRILSFRSQLSPSLSPAAPPPIN